jgi:protein SCO1/2
MFAKHRRDCDLILSIFLMAMAALLSRTAWAQRTEPLPKELEGIAITDHAGAQVPLDLELLDEAGRSVRLADYVNGDRPIILTLVYYECPMLCGVVLQAVVDGLKGLPWTAGEDFEIVTVSFNPRETPQLARLKKQTFIKEYGRPEAAAGWHFLTGREENVRRLADTVGFAYRWDEKLKQYVHATGIFILTPQGRVARTLFGVAYEARTLRLALAEAGRGSVGKATDQLLLYCFHYDANAGRYVVAASNVMRLGGAATLLIVGGWLGAVWVRGARRRRASGEARGGRA